MPNLLNQSQISNATGVMINFFDTFANGKTIIVYKESIKTEISTSGSVFGYGDNQSNSQFTYSEVKQSFPAIIRYRIRQQANPLLPEVDIRHPEAEVLLKLRDDAYLYIESGRTEKIAFDNFQWTIVSGPRKKGFLTLPFYYYEVKRIV